MKIKSTGKSKKNINEKCYNIPSHGIAMLGVSENIPVPAYIDPADGLPKVALSLDATTEAFGLIYIKGPDKLCYGECCGMINAPGHGFTAGDILYLQDDGTVANSAGTKPQRIFEVVDDNCLLGLCQPMCCAEEENTPKEPVNLNLATNTNGNGFYNLPEGIDLTISGSASIFDTTNERLRIFGTPGQVGTLSFQVPAAANLEITFGGIDGTFEQFDITSGAIVSTNIATTHSFNGNTLTGNPGGGTSTITFGPGNILINRTSSTNSSSFIGPAFCV